MLITTLYGVHKSMFVATLPKFIYPDKHYVLLSLALALVLDVVYPRHSGILLLIHPVHTSYVLALKLAKPFSSILRGIAVWLVVVTLHLTFYTSVLYLAWCLSPWLWVAVASWITKCSFSLRLLIDIVKRVGVCSAVNDWECARYWTQQIVRRNVYALGRGHVLSAAIESLAESLVDGFTSPLFFFMFLGPIGALLQRIANTLDGALGFKTPPFKDVGWFSARMDTLLNFVPARATALLYIAFAWVAGSIRRAYTSWRCTATKCESVNACHPMSALAGALGVKLEKPGHYVLGLDHRLPETKDVFRAIDLSLVVAMTWTALIAITIAII